MNIVQQGLSKIYKIVFIETGFIILQQAHQRHKLRHPKGREKIILDLSDKASQNRSESAAACHQM